MSDSERAEHLTELCRPCGLCCNGGLFDVVAVLPGEADRLRARGLPLVSQRAELVLPQPCPARSGAGCACHAERPACCASYECHLYQKLASGALDTGEARARLGRILALVATLRAAFPGADVRSAMRSAVARLSVPPPVAPEHAELALDLATLVHLIRRDIEPRFAAPTADSDEGEIGPSE